MSRRLSRKYDTGFKLFSPHSGGRRAIPSPIRLLIVAGLGIPNPSVLIVPKPVRLNGEISLPVSSGLAYLRIGFLIVEYRTIPLPVFKG